MAITMTMDDYNRHIRNGDSCFITQCGLVGTLFESCAKEAQHDIFTFASCAGYSQNTTFKYCTCVLHTDTELHCADPLILDITKQDSTIAITNINVSKYQCLYYSIQEAQSLYVVDTIDTMNKCAGVVPVHDMYTRMACNMFAYLALERYNMDQTPTSVIELNMFVFDLKRCKWYKARMHPTFVSTTLFHITWLKCPMPIAPANYYAIAGCNMINQQAYNAIHALYKQ